MARERSSFSTSCTSIDRPLKPLRMSVWPSARYTFTPDGMIIIGPPPAAPRTAGPRLDRSRRREDPASVAKIDGHRTLGDGQGNAHRESLARRFQAIANQPNASQPGALVLAKPHLRAPPEHHAGDHAVVPGHRADRGAGDLRLGDDGAPLLVAERPATAPAVTVAEGSGRARQVGFQRWGLSTSASSGAHIWAGAGMNELSPIDLKGIFVEALAPLTQQRGRQAMGAGVLRSGQPAPQVGLDVHGPERLHGPVTDFAGGASWRRLSLAQRLVLQGVGITDLLQPVAEDGRLELVFAAVCRARQTAQPPRLDVDRPVGSQSSVLVALRRHGRPPSIIRSQRGRAR